MNDIDTLALAAVHPWVLENGPVDLSQIVDGYNWLHENSQHFSMVHWAGHRNGADPAIVRPRNTVSAEPECGTVMCICGAAVMMEARRNGHASIPAITAERALYDRLSELNPKIFTSDPELGYTDVEWALRCDIDYVFMAGGATLSDVTLPQVRALIEKLCAKWGYEPAFAH